MLSSTALTRGASTGVLLFIFAVASFAITPLHRIPVPVPSAPVVSTSSPTSSAALNATAMPQYAPASQPGTSSIGHTVASRAKKTAITLAATTAAGAVGGYMIGSRFNLLGHSFGATGAKYGAEAGFATGLFLAKRQLRSMVRLPF